MRFTTFALFASTLLLTAPAIASDMTAAFSATEGKVFLKHNDGVSLVKTGSFAEAGSEVIVGIDASAQLAMAGCDIVLAPGARFVVPQKAPCGKGEVLRVDGVQFTPVNGTPAHESAIVHGPNTGIMLAAGGLAVAGIIGFVVLGDEDKDDAVSAH